MKVIENYSFVRVSGNVVRLARQKEIEIGKEIFICGKSESKMIFMQAFKVKGDFFQDQNGKRYYLGTKSSEMKLFERAIKEKISVITSFEIGYAYQKECIGKHIPCILGKVDDNKSREKIFVVEQEFEKNIVKDINGKKYFIDWTSMKNEQIRVLMKETQQMPQKMKTSVKSFCEKTIKFDMIKLNDYLPILGVAGPFLIE